MLPFYMKQINLQVRFSNFEIVKHQPPPPVYMYEYIALQNASNKLHKLRTDQVNDVYIVLKS
jgi:hypothetical protein